MASRITIGVCVFSILVVETSGTFQINATCDDNMGLYVDGVLEAQNNDKAQVSRVTSGCPRVVAISCVDTGGVGGIYASLGNDDVSYVTDGTWKCANFDSEPPQGWNTASFDDSAWPSSGVIAATAVWDRIIFSGISPEAKWIWTPSWPSDSNVYCRKQITDCGTTTMAEVPTTEAQTTPPQSTTAATETTPPVTAGATSRTLGVAAYVYLFISSALYKLL